MYKELKLYFPGAISGNGLISEISNISWFENINSSVLDTYFILMNGEKLGSRILNNFTNDDGVITDNKLISLANIIHNKFYHNWEKIYNDLTADYNILEDIDIIEKYKGTAKGNTSASNMQSGSIENNTTGTIENIHDTYGFNSSSPVHANKDDTSNREITRTNYNSLKTTITGESEGEDEHELRKTGNAGARENSQLIKNDIELWRLYNFYDIICSDICSFIALSIY